MSDHTVFVLGIVLSVLGFTQAGLVAWLWYLRFKR